MSSDSLVPFMACSSISRHTDGIGSLLKQATKKSFQLFFVCVILRKVVNEGQMEKLVDFECKTLL